MTETMSIFTTLTFKTTSCITCGVIIALPDELYERRLKDHKDYYCPNGHAQHFVGKTEEQKLREQLEAEQRRVIYERNLRQAEERSHSATKGQLTKTKKRAHAAVCPAEGCNRSFVQLSRHMRSKHPELL